MGDLLSDQCAATERTCIVGTSTSLCSIIVGYGCLFLFFVFIFCYCDVVTVVWLFINLCLVDLVSLFLLNPHFCVGVL